MSLNYDDIGYNPRIHARFAEREGFHLESSSDASRTLVVANLAPDVTEEFLTTLFSQVGAVSRVKLVFDASIEPFAFVDMMEHGQAMQALQMLNGRSLMNREMRINWAVEPGQVAEHRAPKPDTSRHFHVFVGDLSAEIDSAKLREAFAPFGEVSDAKIIKDTTTSKAKGYGFVSYPRREDAERAIEQMNGQWLGRRTIRTNWATRKPEEDEHRGGHHRHYYEKTYEEVFNLSSADNTSVYVGNINALTEEEIRRAFDRFGSIYDVRIFKVQGYAFVKYDHKESAARAIVQMNNQEINGQMVRCSWGKSGDANKTSANINNNTLSGAYGYGYGQAASTGAAGGGAQHHHHQQPHHQYSHLGAHGPSAAAGSATAAGVNNQYWQYYAQYYNNPQLMQQWNNYWQGVKGAAQTGPIGGGGGGGANGGR